MENLKKAGMIELESNGKGEALMNEEGIHLKKLFTDNPSFAQGAIMKHPQAEIVDHYDSIVNDDNIDVVIISTSTSKGLDLAGEALRAGKDVRII